MQERKLQERRAAMEKKEFEEMVGQVVSDEDYKIIETVYQHHPVIRDVSGKEEVAELYKSFGITIFYDMITRARKFQDLESQLHHTQAEVDRIKEEMVQNRASMGLDYSRMLDKLADEASHPSQARADGLQRVEITTKKDIGSMFTQVAVDGHVIPYVRGYKLEHVAGKPPILTVDLNYPDLYIDEPMVIHHKALDQDIEIREKYKGSAAGAADPPYPVKDLQ